MAIHDIPTKVGFLAGLSISLVLYGVYCSLFTITLYTRRRCSNKNALITSAVVALFVTCTIIMGLHISICYHALTRFPVMDLTTKAFFVDPLQPHENWYPFKDVLLLCAKLIAEALLIWRLYMIWSKNWKIVVVPVIGLSIVACGGITSATMEFIIFLSPPEKARKLIPLFVHIAGIGWEATVCNNCLCTILIIGKLWQIARTAEGRGTARLANPATGAIIESGALYTSTVLCMVLLAATGMHGVNFVIVPAVPVILGIAPTSIILRLNLISIQKPSWTVQNDATPVQSAPSSDDTPGNFGGRNEPRLGQSETGIATIPEPVFAQPISGFSALTSGNLSIRPISG